MVTGGSGNFTNLTVTGNSTLGTTSTGALTATGLQVNGNATVTGTTNLGTTNTGNLNTTGTGAFSGALTAGSLDTGAGAISGGAASFGSLTDQRGDELRHPHRHRPPGQRGRRRHRQPRRGRRPNVSGASTFGATGTGTLTATGLQVNGDGSLTGNLSVGGTLGVTGVSTFGTTNTGALNATTGTFSGPLTAASLNTGAGAISGGAGTFSGKRQLRWNPGRHRRDDPQQS